MCQDQTLIQLFPKKNSRTPAACRMLWRGITNESMCNVISFRLKKLWKPNLLQNEGRRKRKWRRRWDVLLWNKVERKMAAWSTLPSPKLVKLMCRFWFAGWRRWRGGGEWNGGRHWRNWWRRWRRRREEEKGQKLLSVLKVILEDAWFDESLAQHCTVRTFLNLRKFSWR